MRVTADKKTFQTTIFIAGSHPHFEGHFPLAPVFPGVSQIDLVMDQARREWGEDLRCAGVKRAKYRSILKPDTKVQLALTLLNSCDLSWILSDETQIFSSGDVTVRPSSPSAQR